MIANNRTTMSLLSGVKVLLFLALCVVCLACIEGCAKRQLLSHQTSTSQIEVSDVLSVRITDMITKLKKAKVINIQGDPPGVLSGNYEEWTPLIKLPMVVRQRNRILKIAYVMEKAQLEYDDKVTNLLRSGAKLTSGAYMIITSDGVEQFNVLQSNIVIFDDLTAFHASFYGDQDSINLQKDLVMALGDIN